MKSFAYGVGVLSSLLILATTVPVGATTPTATVAQSNSSSIEQMFREQKVLTDEIKTLMTQMKAMMAEMKALTSLPEGQAPTMADLYKQQQVILAQVQTLSQSRFDTLQPRKNTATVQEVHQQQVAMMAEMKSMMAEMKAMIEAYRGRASIYKR
ncbi:hypothetical protein [Stenomitos frigidus]|uniref:Uncharacterized protein n=1 Tax=Stenomitos frigidus ULC18 TaxID=2107698 RepID=A0A2T1DV66_9CYAN|nr:hypothetical protein [Stenomitos frigidus]PSB24321.1 hypothetical protein C7B82_27315 [Stenomitos frigidus ULC18]